MYEYWFDADGKIHEISKMDIQYISNCLRNLNNWLTIWRGIKPKELTDEELLQKDVVGRKAWFVFHGVNYINAFCDEIEKRKIEES